MNIRFDGKTVAVTGAGHGFGRCIAQTFAHLGARVFATDIAADELAETAAEGGIATKVVDLRDRAAGAAWIRQIETQSRRADPRAGEQCRRRRRPGAEAAGGRVG